MEEEGVYPIYLITKIILKKILNENDKLKIDSFVKSRKINFLPQYID